MNNTATNTATCPTVRKQIGKTTYIVRVHFSQTVRTAAYPIQIFMCFAPSVPSSRSVAKTARFL